MTAVKKFIFVTGGVVSGLGKGITAASLGRLLKNRGFRITLQKLDPYLNLDPGTMNPFQHGEVFVTDDGAETDLDLGHYERFIDENLSKKCSVTAGKIYETVLLKERQGAFDGGTVQVIPHITNEIKDNISAAAEQSDIAIIEIGGTVGDIESLPFLEAIRQFSHEVGRRNCIFIHLTLVPYLEASSELKTKPTQHSVKELLGLGIQPDIIVCRADRPIDDSIRRKIALFCNVRPDCVVPNYTVPVLYEVPISLRGEKLDDLTCELLGISGPECDMSEWEDMLFRLKEPERSVTIAIIGKYVALRDAYLSVAEALKHGGIEARAYVEIRWVDSESVNADTVDYLLADVQGVLVPGGFGIRGIEGMITAVRWAREHRVPYFGICLGMQMAVIEFTRNVLGHADAHSTEMNPDTAHPVIDLMPDQLGVVLGGTMRLGLYPCEIAENTKAHAAYACASIRERHRHRYEFNNDYRAPLSEAGMVLSGISPNKNIVEMVELRDHPWFVGVQFHPEFKSRPNRPHPLFAGFVKAAAELGKQNTE